MVNKRKKTRWSYKKLFLVMLFLVFIISDMMGISLYQQSKTHLQALLFKEVFPIYLTVMVHQHDISLNEKKITFDDLKSELTQWDQQEVIVHLIDYAASTDELNKVHKYIDGEGYRTLISERLPNLSYESYSTP